QLGSKQRHTRANEATQMLPRRRDKICGNRSTEIEDKTGLPGQSVGPHDGQPTIHPQATVILIAICNSAQLRSGLRNVAGSSEGLLQSAGKRLCFRLVAYAHEPYY